MRRTLIVAATAGAVLVAGLVAVPALADTDPATSGPAAATCPMGGPGWDGSGRGNGANGQGPGAGMGRGAGMGPGAGQGMGRRADSGDPLAGLAKGTLTAEQKTGLAGMAEEEKLAHDVYVTLGASSKDARFARIAAAESRHLAEVRALLARYGISDPTAGKGDGSFASASRKQQYDELVARGGDSLEAALAVGRDIEKADIADLATAGTGVTAPDVKAVYGRLSRASSMHLRAFGGTTATS